MHNCVQRNTMITFSFHMAIYYFQATPSSPYAYGAKYAILFWKYPSISILCLEIRFVNSEIPILFSIQLFFFGINTPDRIADKHTYICLARPNIFCLQNQHFFQQRSKSLTGWRLDNKDFCIFRLTVFSVFFNLLLACFQQFPLPYDI